MQENVSGANALQAPQNVVAQESYALFDQDKSVADIKQELKTQSKGRVTKALYKADGIRVVMITLAKDAELKSHTAPGPITVQVLEGQLEFEAEQVQHILKPGKIICLASKIPHQVKAIIESVFLLTMGH